MIINAFSGLLVTYFKIRWQFSNFQASQSQLFSLEKNKLRMWVELLLFGLFLTIIISIFSRVSKLSQYWQNYVVYELMKCNVFTDWPTYLHPLFFYVSMHKHNVFFATKLWLCNNVYFLFREMSLRFFCFFQRQNSFWI